MSEQQAKNASLVYAVICEPSSPISGPELKTVSNIDFTINLKSIVLDDCDIHNFQGLAFLSLPNLASLDFGGWYGSCAESVNRPRSVQSFAKCRMKNLSQLNLDCGPIKSMGRHLSRLQTSLGLEQVVLQRNLDSDYDMDCLRDQDISFLIRLQAQKVQMVEREKDTIFEDTRRVPQQHTEKCIRRRFPKICFGYFELDEQQEMQEQRQKIVIQ